MVEILIVVVIIGIVSAIGAPMVVKAGDKAKARRIARELHIASNAFIEYSLNALKYPSNSEAGVTPEGMGAYLASMEWTARTVIGGQWEWDYDEFGVKAAISLRSPQWPDKKMAMIDAIIDDGILTSGEFRKRDGGYMYVIEE